MANESTTTTLDDLLAGIRRLGVEGDAVPLRRKIVPDDSKPVPTCGGRPVAFDHVRQRPARVSDFDVWRSMRHRDRALSHMPKERHAELCDGMSFGPSPDHEDTVSCSEDYCRNARARIDEWLVASMDKLMRDSEIAGAVFGKNGLFMFSAGTGTGVTPGPEHSHMFTFDDYREARSRLLAAKVAASDAARTEAARRVVLGPIDDEGDA